MDKTDVILSKLLLMNSRAPYRELADKLGLSVTAVHKRVQVLTESGIIRAFTAKISIPALKAVPVVVFGRSGAHSVDEVCEKLRKHGSIYWVAVAGGNYLYVAAYLRSISDLESCVAHVKREARMTDLTVGIESTEPPGGVPVGRKPRHEIALSPLDYQIICALHENSRKPISVVAEELGVSAKTVRRRLSRMIREGLIELSMKWYPDVSNDIMTILHLKLGPSADKSKVGPLLLMKYSPNVFFSWSFSNLPNLILCVVWTPSTKELRDIRERLQGEEFFESIVPNILYTGHIFDTWRDELLLQKGVPKHYN